MYDSFDNMYQATIGIDFLSKVSTVLDGAVGANDGTRLTLDSFRPCIWRTEPYDCSCGIPPAKNDSEA